MKIEKKTMMLRVAGEGVRLQFPERSDEKKKQSVVCEAVGQSYRWVAVKSR